MRLFLVGIALILMILTGCQNGGIDFSEDVFLKYTSSPAGECASYEFFDTNIEVSSDGTVKIYCDDFEDIYSEEYPIKTIHLSKEDINDLKDAIEENNIMDLRKNLSTDSCDGGYQYLTVYTDGDKHKTGGLNVSNRRFGRVESLIFDMVGEDVRELRSEVVDIQEKGYNDEYGEN